MSPMAFAFLGFSVVWILLFLFVLSFSRRQSRLEKELEELRRSRS